MRFIFLRNNLFTDWLKFCFSGCFRFNKYILGDQEYRHVPKTFLLLSIPFGVNLFTLYMVLKKSYVDTSILMLIIYLFCHILAYRYFDVEGREYLTCKQVQSFSKTKYWLLFLFTIIYLIATAYWLIFEINNVPEVK